MISEFDEIPNNNLLEQDNAPLDNGDGDDGDEEDNEPSGIDEFEPGEDTGLPSDSELPPFLQSVMPEGKLNQVKWYLLNGKTAKQLVAEGHNEGTVRTGKSQLVSEGYLKKGTQGPQANRPVVRKTSTAVGRPAGGLQIFAKGSPPEALIQSLDVPDPDGSGALLGFEQGMKFGMTMLVTAVRVVNELSVIGSQQVKPIIDITRSMREGEAMSYKEGAREAAEAAAYKAAQAMGGTIIPAVDEIRRSVERIEKDRGSVGDPVKNMMTRTMEPLIQNMISKIIPGAAAQKAEPQGWSRRAE